MEIDLERQQKARTYARLRRRISLTVTGISFLVILCILALGLDKWLRDLLMQEARRLAFLGWQPLPNWYPVLILAYFLILALAYSIITLPLSYYMGFVLPHRYGMSVMTRKAWGIDLLKGLVLNLILEGGLITLIYALLAFQPQWWWLWTALVILFFSIVMANLAPIIIFPLFYKFTPLPEGELTQRLLALVNKAHTRVRGVYMMKMSHRTTATNAALMGLGNTRRIVLGDNMIDRYSTDEIEVVLAHELGHHVHKHIWQLLIWESLLMLVGLFIGSLMLNWVVNIQHYYLALTDPATMLFFALLVGIFSLVIMPLLNVNSRRCEYQADEYALQATNKAEAFKNAMVRLANQNLAELEPSPIIEFLFYSHPAVSKRLAHADAFTSRSS